MSNLLKQGYMYTTTPQVVPRKIDSNARMEERLRNIVMEYGLDSSTAKTNVIKNANEDFVDGLNPERVESLLPKEDPEEEENNPDFISPENETQILENARAEAAAIIENAKAEAQTIVDEGKHRAMDEFDSQRLAGIAAGQAQLDEKLEKEKARLLQEQMDAVASIQSAYDQKAQTLEKDLIDVFVRVFKKVFGLELDERREILYYLICNTLKNVDAGKNYRFLVSPSNKPFLIYKTDEMKEIVGNEANIEISVDPEMNEDSCHIETDYGTIDCSMDTELNELMKTVKELALLGSEEL